jgi:hypothetical protein
MPPWKPGFAEPNRTLECRNARFQGVVALNDTAANQGGFRCVPSLYQSAMRGGEYRASISTAPKIGSQKISRGARSVGPTESDLFVVRTHRFYEEDI